MRALFLISALTLASCAPTDSPARQTALANVPGKAIGKSVSCISLRDVEHIEALNDYVAFVHMRGKKVYRTDFPAGCPGLKRDATRHTTPVAQYCRGDIIETFDPFTGHSSGSCAFGEFTPYEIPKRKDEG